jgi:AbrB family looped-hinge helix DNA binding protein
MRITEKGQVTIPIDIRHHMNMNPGDEVEFVVEDNLVVLRKSSSGRSRGRWVVDHLLSHTGDVDMSTDEIMALTRGE